MTNNYALTSRMAEFVQRLTSFLMLLSGWRRYGVAVGAGLLAALSLAPIYALPLLPVGFSILILLIDSAVKGPSPKRTAFGVGWCFGFGYFLIGLYWMAFSFFVQADQFAWMAPFAVMGMPAFLAFFTGTASLIASLFWRDGWQRVVIFACIWAVFEYLRGHILTGLPWNLTGQALAGSAIGAQSAAFYGAYGLSLVVVLLSVAPAAGLHQGISTRSFWAGSLVLLFGTLLLFGFGALRLSLPTPESDGKNFLRIVQPNIPQREKIDPTKWGQNFNRQLDLSRGSIPADARLFIVWPENGVPLLDEAPTALSVLTDELPENAVLIAGSVHRRVGEDGRDQYFNSIAMVPHTPQGRRVVGFYDKSHLVPFGEYLPFYGLLKRLGLAQLTPYGDAGFAAGAGPTVLNAGGPSFSPLICYEVIFSGRMYPRGQRPEWLVTVTNDAWFGDSSGPRQHLDQARLRSIETGLPMARSANTGISAVIDAKGRILGRITLYESGRIELPLPPAIARPLYDRVGDWLFGLMVLMCLAAAFGLKGKSSLS